MLKKRSTKDKEKRWESKNERKIKIEREWWKTYDRNTAVGFKESWKNRKEEEQKKTKKKM